jgi:hypothetical protein
MRFIGMIGTAVLSLTLAAPVYAQQEQHDQKEENEKPAQENEKKAQPEKATKPDENRSAKPEEKNAKQEQRAPEAKPAKQEQHAAGRIPDDRYKANFGREHTFRVSQSDFRSGRFQYGGYWFGFGGAWPSNWLYTQDVYVIEINGMYYLCNPSYPGVNLAINVTM